MSTEWRKSSTSPLKNKTTYITYQLLNKETRSATGACFCYSEKYCISLLFINQWNKICFATVNTNELKKNSSIHRVFLYLFHTADFKL